jgi:hypothetical protein
MTKLIEKIKKIFIDEDNKTFRVGVVGYSSSDFNEKEAIKLIKDAFDKIPKKDNISIVSGLTYVGILGLAYDEAVKRKWKTVGIACSKANEYKCFKVDTKVIIGDNWGDESKTFLDNIDMLIRIGGGEQSKKETKLAKSRGLKVIEYDLERTKK